jgi:hypothetical protein
MGLAGFVLVLAVILNTIEFGQDAFGSNPQNEDDFVIAQKIAIAALNFRQGDANGFNRAHANFTPTGWKEFVKHMEGYLDAEGTPTFTSTFVATRAARTLDDKEGVIHFRIPGTMTQSNQLGKTTYQRFAIEVSAVRDPTERRIKIQRLEQITCLGSSKACD